MYISDESVQEYLTGAVLLAFPFLGIALGTWGFFWEVLMLFAVFLVGHRKGLVRAIPFLIGGYGAAVLIFGFSALSQMSFVPLAGLLGIFGWQSGWPGRVTFFWGAMLAAVLGALPTLSFVRKGFDEKTVGDLINATLQQYHDSGLLARMQEEQGLAEEQIRALLEQGIQLYVLVIPSIAALIAIFQFGFVYYSIRRWFKDGEGSIPFTQWRLPWYAIWGAIIGIACYLLGNQFSWPVFRGLGINLMVINGAISLILGVAVYLHFLKSPRIPKWLKWILVISSIIYFFFTVISMIMFGLFDLVFNFRRLSEESKEL